MGTILVTGGAGFIGSHLVERLLNRGHRVLVLDDFSTGSRDNLRHLNDLPGLCIIEGCLSRTRLLRELVNAADVVFHLAASVGVMKILDEPVRMIQNNVGGTDAVLRAAKSRRRKVIVASTSEVYGKSGQLPFAEDADLLMGPTSKSRWAYACGKALDEFLALAYWQQYRVPTIVVRLFNTIGPRQLGRYGMVVPRFLAQAAEGQDLTVYGTGEQSRCFTYVSDTVEWLVRLATLDAAVGEVFNLGNPTEVTITQLARKVIEVTGADVSIRYAPYEQAYGSGFEDIARRVPAIRKVVALTGYSPRVALSQALQLTNAWLGAHEARRSSFAARAAA